MEQQHIASTSESLEPKPTPCEPRTMDPRSWFRDLTWYFVYLLSISTMGPLLFGYHLVSRPHHRPPLLHLLLLLLQHAQLTRPSPSSTSPRTS